MNNMSPITRAFLTVGIGVFIGILPVFMIINSLSTTAIKFCGRYGSDYTIVDLDTPFGSVKRCVVKD
jgi:galactitol-specific phosphotransferase system IIC component